MTTRKEWICTALDSAGGQRVQGSPTVAVPMGIADRAKLWKKDTSIRLRFLNEDPALHQRVLASARAWLVDGVRLDMRLARADEDAELRVGFNRADGSWSYIGTDNLAILPSQPTMNLGWASLDTPQDDFDSVVIHEFGHALGLLHEHNHPEALIRWNKPAVYQDLGGPPNRWSKAAIDSNVFARFDASTVITTDFDHASVMIYTIPTHWTMDGRSFMPSPRLSPGDAGTIRRLYA